MNFAQYIYRSKFISTQFKLKKSKRFKLFNYLIFFVVGQKKNSI